VINFPTATTQKAMSAINPKAAALTPLYERDYYSWAREQARALREHRLDDVDWENLAEEVDDLAGRHADALEGHCETLIEHLLKLAYEPRSLKRNNLRLWQASVRNARHKIQLLLKRNPGLRTRTDELFNDAWPVGRNDALAKLDLDDDAIPEAPCFTFQQAAAEEFPPPRPGRR
jgi:Domain of unknown function DUF29